MTTMNKPSERVLQAFGANMPPKPLGGGQGQNYQSGNLVFKPAQDDAETIWIAEFYLSVEQDRFRVPKPVRSNHGGYVYDGWQVWEYLMGRHEPRCWHEKIALCNQFHQAIADYPRPVYFDQRDQNPWVISDKVTWGELEFEHQPQIASVVSQLRCCLRPVDDKPQLIHGDFGGNVMFSADKSPAIIDFSPYWRPAAFALGVVVADAIVWGKADHSLIEVGAKCADNFDQHLARAELRRIIELDTLSKMYGWNVLGQIQAHLPLVRAIQARCS